MILEAKDLRVGNLIEWSEYASMGRGQDKVSLHNIGYSQLMKPIMLTEEWLIKFGFSEGFDWYSQDFHFPNRLNFIVTPLITRITSLSSIVSVIGNSGVDGHRTHLAVIKYVHELQNIHFALTTGEELIIKE